MHDANTRLLRLTKGAVRGEPLLMTRAGKQTVRVAVIEVGPPPRRDLIAGDFTVSDDFDSMGADEVGALFEGAPPRNPAVNLLIDT